MKEASLGAALTVHLVDGSGTAAIQKLHDDGTIVIHLPATTADRDKNQALISFLAAVLQVEEKQIELVAGANRADKLISVIGISPEQVDQKVFQLLGRQSKR